MAFSPDGIHLASGTDIGKIKIGKYSRSPARRKCCTTAIGSRTRKIPLKPVVDFIADDGGFQKPMDYWIGAMTFTPDAKLLMTGSRDTTIKLFEMPNVVREKYLTGHKDVPLSRGVPGRESIGQRKRRPT